MAFPLRRLMVLVGVTLLAGCVYRYDGPTLKGSQLQLTPQAQALLELYDPEPSPEDIDRCYAEAEGEAELSRCDGLAPYRTHCWREAPRMTEPPVTRGLFIYPRVCVDNRGHGGTFYDY